MKRSTLIAAVAALAMVGTTFAFYDVKDAKCPVSGAPVKEASFLAFNDAKVYFCCNNCPKAFEKDTAKYTAKANHQIILTGQATQVACPFSGGELDDDATVEIKGVTVKFCCENCQGKAKKAEGDEQINLVFGEKAFEKGFKVKK